VALSRYTPVTVLWLSFITGGCTTTGSTDPSSINFGVPPGSRLVLHREVHIGAEYSHARFQAGEQTAGVDRYEVNCRLEQRDLGPTTLVPDSFLITRSGRQREWINHPHTMRFYMEFHLRSERQPGVRKLVCQHWDGPLTGRPVTVTQIRQALGDSFSLEFGPAP
jgi:hypothetical protein